MNPAAANSRVDDQTPQAFILARNQREGFLRHFGFRESPFGVTPDPEFLFWSERHSGALQALINSIESNLGFSVLLGQPGTGKTTLLFHLLAQYRESARTAFVFQTQCRPHDLIRHIASELDLPLTRGDEVFLHRKLNEMLLKEARAGRKVLIVIDEAQNLHTPSLEAIRLLSDFETGPSKLLQVVLSGSPQLGETLLNPNLWQLAQRITTICRLEPLSEDEVQQYVTSRLAVVTSRAPKGFFSPESLAEVAFHSGGVPRIVNSICHGSLVLAYAQGRSSVSKELVRQAANELDFSEPGNRELRAATKHSETVVPRSSRTGFAVPRGKDTPTNGDLAGELRRKTPQSLVDTVGGSNNPNIVAQAASPIASKSDTNLHAHPILAKADRGGWIRVPTSFVWKADAWKAAVPDRRTTGLLAGLVVLAFVSWLGWNDLRGAPTAGGRQSPKPSEEVAQTSVQQPNPLNAQPSTNISTSEVSGTRTPQHSVAEQSAATETAPAVHEHANVPVDTRPNLVPPSKIARSEIGREPLAPVASVLRVPKSSEDLSPLVAASRPVLPRLETPEAVGPSKPTSSLQPIKIVRPEYPAKAKLSHIEGEVQLELTIDRNGKVQKVRGLSGNSILLQAAEEAASHWQYPPSADDQRPALAVTKVRFNFNLNSQ
jgi:TonB family protein